MNWVDLILGIVGVVAGALAHSRISSTNSANTADLNNIFARVDNAVSRIETLESGMSTTTATGQFQPPPVK